MRDSFSNRCVMLRGVAGVEGGPYSWRRRVLAYGLVDEVGDPPKVDSGK